MGKGIYVSFCGKVYILCKEVAEGFFAFPTPHTYVHDCSNVFFFLLFFYSMWIAIVNGCGNVSH